GLAAEAVGTSYFLIRWMTSRYVPGGLGGGMIGSACWRLMYSGMWCDAGGILLAALGWGGIYAAGVGCTRHGPAAPERSGVDAGMVGCPAGRAGGGGVSGDGGWASRDRCAGGILRRSVPAARSDGWGGAALHSRRRGARPDGGSA